MSFTVLVTTLTNADDVFYSKCKISSIQEHTLETEYEF